MSSKWDFWPILETFLIMSLIGEFLSHGSYRHDILPCIFGSLASQWKPSDLNNTLINSQYLEKFVSPGCGVTE